MSVVPFTDGFPNEPLAAINFSYFLTPDEKKEWMDWLASAKPEQQDELVQILHQMWESAKAENPNGAPAPAATQSAPIQQMQQPQPQMQQPHQNFGQPQMMPPQPLQGQGQMPPNFGQTQQQFNPNFGQPQMMPQGQMTPQGQMQPQPQMQQPRPNNNMMGNPAAAAIASLSQSQPPMGMQNMQPQQYAQPMMQQPQMPPQYMPQAPMQQPLPPPPVPETAPEFSFDTEEDVKNYVPEKPVEQVIPQPKAPSKVQKIEEEEIEELDNDFMSDGETVDSDEISTEENKTEKQVSGIDFSAIRDNADKEEINKLTDEFLTAREAHEKAYTDLIKKNTKIFSDFEDINDYIESMTDKVLTINDQVINQGEEIQSLKNGTQARGSSLQDQTDEIRYDIEKLIKEIRNVKIEQKRAVDEIRTRLSTIEANSFRNDGNDFELKYNILKSQVEKLQQQNNFDKIVPKSEPVTKSSRAERLNSISSKNFVG
jgi:hypothetical protein